MKKKFLVFVAALLASTSGMANDRQADRYEVTITNITQGQTFTPLLVATHRNRFQMFESGTPASPELATIAESGNIGPMDNLLQSMPNDVLATANSAGQLPNGLLGPGQSVTVEIKGSKHFNHVSVVAMLIPTNDTFVALNNVALPRQQSTHVVPAYDAGSEFNDELCANIPGPTCGGAGDSVEDGEGFVHTSIGVQGIGDLQASSYDWRNPVARISIRRLR